MRLSACSVALLGLCMLCVAHPARALHPAAGGKTPSPYNPQQGQRVQYGGQPPCARNKYLARAPTSVAEFVSRVVDSNEVFLVRIRNSSVPACVALTSTWEKIAVIFNGKLRFVMYDTVDELGQLMSAGLNITGGDVPYWALFDGRWVAAPAKPMPGDTCDPGKGHACDDVMISGDDDGDAADGNDNPNGFTTSGADILRGRGDGHAAIRDKIEARLEGLETNDEGFFVKRKLIVTPQ